MEAIIRMYPSLKLVNICDLKPEDIHIEDIAHHLSLTNRFGGGTETPYSVAAHCIYLANNLVSEDNRFAGLMHDATEAYVGDMVKPLKVTMPQFDEAEAIVWAAVANKYGLPEDLPEEVHLADKQARDIESYHLQGNRGGEYELARHNPKLSREGWRGTERKFLRMFYELSPQRMSEAA